MKKLFTLFAAALMAVSVNAQENTAITANKAGDNWYVGINAGVATPMQKWDYAVLGDKGAGFFKGFSPKVGVRVGKNFTTVFGLVADADLYFEASEKSLMKSYTFIDGLSVDLLGTINLMNAFAGYKGEPRRFEISALGGFGWTHVFGGVQSNLMNAKAGLNFALNLGSAKAWQVYLEPAVVYGLWGNNTYGHALSPYKDFKFDSRAGIIQLSAGVNYKFGNSNGTHNFAKAQLRDQAEVDGLNSKINELRNAVSAKDGQLSQANQTIADLRNKLANQKPATAAPAPVKKEGTVLQPTVIFRQGKSIIDPAQYANVEMVAKYMKNHSDAKVLIKGYASPEGSAELNQKLSEKRAEAVKTALVKKYKIAADRIQTQGLGATDKLFDEVEFNRVATFTDTAK